MLRIRIRRSRILEGGEGSVVMAGLKTCSYEGHFADGLDIECGGVSALSSGGRRHAIGAT